MSHESVLEKLIKSIEKANQDQTKELKDYITKELRDIKQKLEEEKLKTANLEVRYSELEAKYNALAKSTRKNNVVVFGLEYTGLQNLCNFTIEQLNHYLQIDLEVRDINNIYTIGKTQGNNKPILIQFGSYLKKLEVLKECRKLKGTQISISHDLNVQERNEQKILRHHLKAARAKKLQCYIKNNQLFINDQGYTAKELEENVVHYELGDNLLDAVQDKSEPSTSVAGELEQIGNAANLGNLDNKPDLKKKKTHVMPPLKTSSRLASKLKD